MKNIILSVFSHELKNTLASIKFGIEMLDKYEMSKDEKKSFIENTISTIDNSIQIIDEYMDFMKFQFRKKLKYEYIDIYQLLKEIKSELAPFIQEKSINLYIQRNDLKILSNKFWLKRAIYNIILNAIKYNKIGGSINVKIENDIFGIYISISDTGIGINKKNLSSIFKMFKQIDETKKGVGIGLALAKTVIDSFGGKIHVKSNENIGTEFILYIPKKPKDVTIKKLALGLIPASIVAFLTISYFPIYSQSYVKTESDRYIIYKLEDGSILKYTKNSNYELKAYKNLYNTKYTITSTIHKGDMTLKAIKNKASIFIDNREFNNLGTDFEIIKEHKAKIAVFSGKVKSEQLMLNKGDGGIIGEKHIKVVALLSAPKCQDIKDSHIKIQKIAKAKKYKVIIALDRNFINIEDTIFSVDAKIPLKFKQDTLYYLKIFSYDKYGLPSMPTIVTYVNLSHYKKALKYEKNNISKAILELKTSVSTIGKYSNLPYYELAKIYFNQKKYKKSLYYIQQAIKIKQTKEEYYILFDNYYKLNKLNKINNLDELLRKYPNDIKFLFYKALLLYKNHNYQKASKILFRILQQNPKLKNVNLLLSKILFKMGKQDEAKYYERLSK